MTGLRHLSRMKKNNLQEQGFVLVATLFAVAIIALAAAFFASRVDELRTGAFATQRWAEAERDAFSLRETLLHAAAKYTRDERGLAVTDGSLAVDGRPYRVSDSVTIRVQDERGLLGVNLAEDRLLGRFFTSVGIPAAMHARMVDGLNDYIDDDDLRRLNGAERPDYATAKRPPPANDFLHAPEELANVMGWERVFAALDRADAAPASNSHGIRARFTGLFTTARHAGVNINSAPAAVLAAVPGLDPSRIDALIDQRMVKPLGSLAEVLPFSNGRLDEEIVGLVGANDWRITIAKADLPFLLECRLTITPGDKDRPTRLKECRRRSVDAIAVGLPNEFSLALRELGGNSSAPPQPTTLTAATDIRKTNFADRNERRESSYAIETPAPRWLAEVVEPVRHGVRQLR